eukprot:195158-Hanusia_phi.AAC.1
MKQMTDLGWSWHVCEGAVGYGEVDDTPGDSGDKPRHVFGRDVVNTLTIDLVDEVSDIHDLALLCRSLARPRQASLIPCTLQAILAVQGL